MGMRVYKRVGQKPIPAAIEGVSTKQRDGVCCDRFVPQLFQTRGGENIHTPKQTDHFSEQIGLFFGSRLRNFSSLCSISSSTVAPEQGGVWHPVNHKPGQHILGDCADELVCLLQTFNIEACRIAIGDFTNSQ